MYKLLKVAPAMHSSILMAMSDALVAASTCTCIIPHYMLFIIGWKVFIKSQLILTVTLTFGTWTHKKRLTNCSANLSSQTKVEENGRKDGDRHFYKQDCFRRWATMKTSLYCLKSKVTACWVVMSQELSEDCFGAVGQGFEAKDMRLVRWHPMTIKWCLLYN